MDNKVDEAMIVVNNFLADHKECNNKLTELKDQLSEVTDSNNKHKHELELEIEKKIGVITLETQQKSESKFKQKLKETEEIYINKIRALIQRSIEIKEENEQLKTKLKVHHNETLQITMLEQQNNLLTERIALIEKCMGDRIVSLENENKNLENRVKILNDRITVLENQNKKS